VNPLLPSPFAGSLPGAGARVSRRQALKIGGMSVSLAALVAACGGQNGTDAAAPGRVGYAPPVTDPPNYGVDDAVLLRTASSLEYTILYVYQQVVDSVDGLDPGIRALLTRVKADHEDIAERLAGLTEDVGGEPWNCTNEWLMDRLVEPVLELIADSDDPVRDTFNFAVALENLAASTHQEFAVVLEDTAARVAALEIATLESRQAAAMVVTARGADGFISPALVGDDIPTDDAGIPQQFAITDRFGSVAQSELTVGRADENGVRTRFNLQPPAENSFVYNELDPTC
jgi:hypothetical protein